MTPTIFGPSHRRLFGVVHEPSQDRANGRAYLLCMPFGHEALRVHRFYRLLAERLARQGAFVLRFDCYGAGDSAGDDDEAELAGWSSDICEANQELLRHSNAAWVGWFGARLGGSAALLAVRETTRRPHAAILWDAVFDGARYLKELQLAHLNELEHSYSAPDRQWRRSIDRDPSAFSGECLGFSISETMRTQILDLGDLLKTPPDTVALSLYSTQADDIAARWAAAVHSSHPSIRLHFEHFEHPLIWTSRPFANNEMVPARALQKMTEALHEHQ